ncbi:hypothetical protein ACM1RC_28285 [Paenibacillus azoreducens]|uniref:hypothetical protein n=1 Tax=Paenibacillus azoreducens TaxID=116718 RepID=UPI0039F45E56
MNPYTKVPETIVRKLAKVKGIKKLNGKEKSEIVGEIVKAGHKGDLEHLASEFAFTKSNCGLIIERMLEPFQKEADTPEKFIKLLLEREKISRDSLTKVNWEVDFDDNIKICGILQVGDVVYLNTVQRRYSSSRSGWDGSTTNSYADIIPVAIHFGNSIIEYRTTPTYYGNVKKFVLDLLEYKEGSNMDVETLTKVTAKDANAIKALLQASYSSEHIALPSTIGSVRLNSSRGTNDLENDELAIKIRKFFEENQLPSNDRMDVTCHLHEFEDRVTKITFPVTFDINIKSGNLKFKSLVTQSVIDHVFDAIVAVCFINKQTELDKKNVEESVI